MKNVDTEGSVAFESLPRDQDDFIINLTKSFEESADHENDYFIETLSFLKENCFLEPLVWSMRAVMNQGFLLFPEYVQYSSYNKQESYNELQRNQFYQHFGQSFLSIIVGIVSKTLDQKINQTQNWENDNNMLINENMSNNFNKSKHNRNYGVRYDDNTRSTVENETNDQFKYVKPDNFINKHHLSQNDWENVRDRNFLITDIPSSRGYTTRLNTMSSSDENLHIYPEADKNYVTVNAVTPSTNFDPEVEVERYLEYSKAKTAKSKNKKCFKSKLYEANNARTDLSKMSRHSSMAKIDNYHPMGSASKFGSLRNISSRRLGAKSRSNNRKKSIGSMRMPKHKFSGNYQWINSRVHPSQVNSGYATLLNDSSVVKETTGEYTYGKGGLAFTKSEKVSKFDEDKLKIYSPGPARYAPKTKKNSTTFTFGKEKKEFSFVQKKKKVPSPGKYDIKRDFLSRSRKR